MPSILTRYAGALSALPVTQTPFRLIDVGCSGGIDPTLVQALPNLQVDGFDPLVEEVARLNSLNIAGHRYHNYFVVGKAAPPKSERLETNDVPRTSFHLTSAFAAQETLRLKGSSYTQEVFNSGSAPTFTSRKTSIDDFMSESDNRSPNFLKIDTDGHDYFVLQGAADALGNLELLGVEIECQFHGLPGPNQNTFSNIDELMRESGFTLFALETYKYSRAELPQPFVWNLFAQTTSGQVQWGEALYLRDPTMHKPFLDFLSKNGDSLINFLRVLLYFDLPDVAVATLKALTKEKGESLPWFNEFLDQVVPVNLIGASTYETYTGRFDKSPELFLPSHWRFPGSQIMLKLEGLARRIKKFRL